MFWVLKVDRGVTQSLLKVQEVPRVSKCEKFVSSRHLMELLHLERSLGASAIASECEEVNALGPHSSFLFQIERLSRK